MTGEQVTGVSSSWLKVCALSPSPPVLLTTARRGSQIANWIRSSVRGMPFLAARQQRVTLDWASKKGDEAHASDGKLVLNSDRHAAAHREAQAAQCGQWGRRDVSAADRSSAIIFRRSRNCHRPPRPSIGRSEAFRTTRETASGETDRSKTQSGTAASCDSRSVGIHVAFESDMLKLLGSYALAKLLGFGLVGAIVIYALLSLLT